MSPFRKTYEIIATAFTLLFGIVAILLAFGCAPSGLYAMSDQWCAKHPGASVNRCTPDPSKATTYCRYGDHTGDPACGTVALKPTAQVTAPAAPAIPAPISAVAVRTCDKVGSIFVTLDAKHAVRFGADNHAEYTVGADGKVSITQGGPVQLEQVYALAEQAVMQMTVSVPCGQLEKGQQSTSLHKVADVPQNSENTNVHAVMFEMEYDAGGNIRHAEVVGGYATEDNCREAMPKVYAIAGNTLTPGLIVQLECSGVHAVVGKPRAEGTTDL